MRLEWLILADAAEVIGGKLYLMGGGWDNLTIAQSLPSERQLAIAASFRVPWNETNQRHTVEIEVASEDGAVLGAISGQVEVGRPPGAKQGQDQRSQVAFGMNAKFGALGTYVIVARVEGEEQGRVPFNVIAGPQFAGPTAIETPGGA